jgi:hypothetical protein
VLVRLAQPQHRVPGLARGPLLARRLVLAGTLLLAASAACRREPAGPATAAVVVSAQLLPAQPTVGPATLAVTLSGATPDTLQTAAVDVLGHMTHPGMTPVVATITRRGPDIFDAALDLNMAGDWLLIATVRFPDGRRLETRVPARVQPRQP